MLSIMLDTETVDILPSAIILTLGAVKFNPFSLDDPYDPFYARLHFDEQSGLGRTLSEDTMAWWGRQSPEAQEEAFGEEGRIGLAEFIPQFRKYIVGADQIWSQGSFDINILEHLFRDTLKEPIPWRHGVIRDSRTTLDMGDDSVKTGNTLAHNALADAFTQAQAVQHIYKQLGVKPKR